MNRSEIHQAISDALAQLDTINNRLYLHSEPLPRLEIDLLRKQAIDCYSLINKLALVANQTMQGSDVNQDQKTSNSDGADQSTKEHEKPKEHAPILEKKEEKTQETKEYKTKPSKKQEMIKPAEEVRQEVKEAVEETKESSVEESDSVVDKLRNEGTSIADRFSNQGIDDIKKAISISKRFEIQSALFDNDRVMYEKTIEYFNSASSQSEGLARFKEMMDAHNWDNESKLVQELEQMVERRYV